MFCLDVETMNVESTAVLLSVGIVYYDGESPLSYQGLLDQSIFVKFDSIEQKKGYGRSISIDTLEWWKKQAPLAQKTNLLPHSSDRSLVEGMQILKRWFTSKPDYKTSHIWTRGSLDQMVFESALRSANMEPFVPYNNYRDVRTAIDCFYPNAKNGYLDVDTNKVPDFNRDHVLKHHPVHDSAYDLCMLFGGVQ